MTDICRLCLHNISIYFTIYKDDVPNETKIKAIIPEIDLQMTSSLTLCNLCSRLLSVTYHFKRECLKTEENLQQFLKERSFSGPLDLMTYKNLKGVTLRQIKNEIFEEDDSSIDIKQEQFDVSSTYDDEDHNGNNGECLGPNNCDEELSKGQLHCLETITDDKSLSIGSDLKIDLSIEKSPVLSFNCDVCGKHYATKNSLKRHMHTHISPQSFVCSVCNRELSDKYLLKRHMEVHSNDSYACNVCGMSLPGKLALKKHLLIMHRRPIICETCGIICPSKNALIEHIRTHTGERPFRCEICGKGFAQRSTLTTHIVSMHETKTPYVCANCGKAFRTNGSLTKHLLVHRDENAEKTVLCKFENCGKMFYNTRNRDQHMVCHRERNVLCNLCGAAFVTKYSLTKHMRVHTGEKPYECHTCHKTFSQRNNLQVHFKSHRPKIKKGNAIIK